MPIRSDSATSTCAAAKCRSTRQTKRRLVRGSAPRCSYMSFPPPEGERHEDDDGDVEYERRHLDPAEAARKLVELERNVDRAAYGGHPFPPGALAPKAVGLGEPHGGVDDDQAGDDPELRIAGIF